jgi:ParB-like chromosome segregation protein Spo0J
MTLNASGANTAPNQIEADPEVQGGATLATKKTTILLALSQIEADCEVQSRTGLDEDTIADYAEAMQRGDTFPPVVVYFDGLKHWLADGFHRLAAAQLANRHQIPAEVRPGTRRDALLFACQANARNGLRFTNADKRRAVGRLLHDTEWRQWSAREIARRCGVTGRFVDKLKAELSANGSRTTELVPGDADPGVLKCRRKGVEYLQRVRRPEAAEEVPAEVRGEETGSAAQRAAPPEAAEKPARRLSLLLNWARNQKRDQLPACLSRQVNDLSQKEQRALAQRWRHLSECLGGWADSLERRAR